MTGRLWARYGRWGWYAGLLAVVIGIVHGWTVSGTFLSDDYDWVTTSERNLESGRWWAPLVESSGGNFYRPLQMLTFTLDRAVAHGRVPAVYHLDQLLLFFGLCLSIAWLVEAVSRRRDIAFSTGLIMAVYPSHHEVVTWVAGRADILAALFVTLSSALAIQFVRRGQQKYWWLLVVTSLLALMGKESALVLPGVHILSVLAAKLIDRQLPWRRIGLALIPSVIALAVILFIRSRILTDAIGGYRVGGDTRGLNIRPHDFWAPLTSAGMLVNISYLRHVAGDNIIVQFILSNFFRLRTALPLAAGLIALALLWWRGWRQWLPISLFAVAWTGITFVPTLALSYAIGANLEGSRLFFLPSIGYSLLWAILIALVFSSVKRSWQLPIGLSILLLFFGSLSVFNGQPWMQASAQVADMRAKLLAEKNTLIPASATDVLVLSLPSKTFGAYQFLGKHAIRAVAREAAGRELGVYQAGAERYTDSPFCSSPTQRRTAIIRWDAQQNAWVREYDTEKRIAQTQGGATVVWSPAENPWTTTKLEQTETRYTILNGQSGIVLETATTISGVQYKTMPVALGQEETNGAFGSRRATLAWSSDQQFTAARQISYTIPANETSFTIPLCQYAAWVMAEDIHALRLRPQQSGSFELTSVTLKPE